MQKPACVRHWRDLQNGDSAHYQGSAEKLVLDAPFSHEAVTALRAAVPRQGLATLFQGAPLRDLARDVVGIAASGLRARGLGEEVFLAPLHEIVAGAPSQAEHWLSRYNSVWAGDVTRIFAEAEI